MDKRKIMQLLFVLSTLLLFAALALGIQQKRSAAIITGVIGLILLVTAIVFAIYLERKTKAVYHYETPASIKEKRNQAQEIYKQRVEEAIQRATSRIIEIAPNKVLTAIKFDKLLNNDVCMVCKLYLNETDEILQCPVCESLYHKDHLLDWIRTKNSCPVCAQQLLEIIDK